MRCHARIVSGLYNLVVKCQTCFIEILTSKCNTSIAMIQCKTFFMLFKSLTNFLLMGALGCGVYDRWKENYDPAFVYIGFAFLVVSAIAFALTYYFAEKHWVVGLWRLYVGFVTGVVAFTDHSVIHEGYIEEVMRYLLLTSILMRCLYDILIRLFDVHEQNHSLFSIPDLFETSGMGIASIICGKEVLPLLLLLTAIQVVLVTIRLKCVVSVLYLGCIAVFSGIVYFPKLRVLPVSPLALAVFLSRVSLAPVLDLYFVNKTCLERWTGIISKRAIFHKFLLLCVVFTEVTFLTLTAMHIVTHKEWFVVVPLFFALSVVWLCYHFVFLVQCWILSNKLAQGYQMFASSSVQNKNFTQILASKGLRHFSLLSHRLVCVTLMTTFLMGAIGWNTKTPISFSLLLVVVPFETVLLSLLREMGNTLGGTCVGYALVSPPLPNSGGQSVVLLHPDVQQQANAQATQNLSLVQNFFAFHLIETFGCDFTSSGITEEFLLSKLKLFFNKVTSDGPCYDTYLLYYSGPVHASGDWALCEGKSLNLSALLEAWTSGNVAGSARLILVLDTEHSNKWLKPLQRVRGMNYVGIQTCSFRDAVDIEGGRLGKIGDLTKVWMDYNSSNLACINLSEPCEAIRLHYTVTREWTDFRFHLPTDADMKQHWEANFPSLVHPVLVITNFPDLALFCGCCAVFWRCLRRKVFAYLPPKQLDTGHGFKLVKTR